MPAPTHILAVVAALILSVLAAAPAQAEFHPQDGPHADVRIRIGDDRVQFTITMNLVWIDEIIDVIREDPDRLDPVEGDPVRDSLLAYYTEHNTITIDGVEVDPVVTTFEVGEPDLTLLPLFPVSGARGLQKVLLVLNYATLTRPKQVSMVWGTYPEDILLSTPDMPRLLDIGAEMNAFGLMSIITFTSGEPEYTWHDLGATPEERMLPVPEAVQRTYWKVSGVSIAIVATMLLLACSVVFSSGARRHAMTLVVVLAGMGASAYLTRGATLVRVPSPFDQGPELPTANQALEIFRPLHTNIYRAFDFTDREKIYDALAQSVDGDLLDDLYDEIYRSLIMEEEGGAVSSIQRVEPISNRVESIGVVDGEVAFRVVSRWQVEGGVYHWGHSHQLVNEYQAEYSVVARDGGKWKIVGNRMLEQKRVDAGDVPPSERGL